MHIVGISEGLISEGPTEGGAAAQVDRPGKAVILVLSAYGPVAWDVTVTPQTRIAQVTLGGYSRHTVHGLPRDVVVREQFREGSRGGPTITHCHKAGTARMRQMVRAGRRITVHRATVPNGRIRRIAPIGRIRFIGRIERREG